jgi:hypothetical protein
MFLTLLRFRLFTAEYRHRDKLNWFPKGILVLQLADGAHGDGDGTEVPPSFARLIQSRQSAARGAHRLNR